MTTGRVVRGRGRGMAVRAPEDRRFRRSRAGPASRRRRAWLGWLVAAVRPVLLTAVAAAGVYGGSRALLASSQFTVQHVNVKGNQRLSAGEVRALLGGLIGESILVTDLGAWHGRVLASPWVAAAELRRILPATVEVRVVERVPLGVGRANGSLYLLDEAGMVIDEYGPQYADLDLPILDGLAGERDAGRLARAALARAVIADLATRPDLLERVSQIDVSDPRDAVVLLDGDPARLHVGDTAFSSRLQSYLELSSALRTRVPAIDYVDLRFDRRVFVRPAPDGATGAVQRNVAVRTAFR